MPTADAFEWPQGQPLFEAMWRSVTEALAGNGIVSNGDLEVTTTGTAMEIEVAAGEYFSVATTHSLGAAETHTLSEGDADNDRWDTVWYDTGTEQSGVTEGTPEADPEPPDVTGDQEPLAFVYVAAEATDVADADVLNWRATFSNEAEEVHYDDTTGEYGVSNVSGALDELQEAAQLSAHPLAPGTDLDVDGYPFQNTDLANSSITVAGNDVSLGGSTGVDHGDLGAIATDDHHIRFGEDSADSLADIPNRDHASLTGIGADDHHAEDHATRHEDGGADAIAEGSLTPQDPTAHASSHHSGGADEVDHNSLGLGADDHHVAHEHPGDQDATDDITDDQGNTVYDYSEQEVPSTAIDYESIFHISEQGEVQNGDFLLYGTRRVPDGVTFEVRRLHAVGMDAGPLPTDVNITISTFDDTGGGRTAQTTVFTGDGSNVSEVTGITYENTSGATQTVGITAENDSGGAEGVVLVAVCELET